MPTSSGAIASSKSSTACSLLLSGTSASAGCSSPETGRASNPFITHMKTACWLFGSELKVLMARPGQRREIDLVSLQQYLALEHIPAPRTILKGINKLQAGTSMVLDEGGISIRRYWDPDLAQARRAKPRKLAARKEELVEHLREAVRLEMISDVPLGVFLSRRDQLERGGCHDERTGAGASEVFLHWV